MIAVTGVWGLHGRDRRVENVYTFLQHLKVSCLVVELAFDDEPWGLDRGGAHVPRQHQLVLLRGQRARHDVFQKEALCNAAVEIIGTTDAVAWVDADVVFLNPHWARDAMRELEHAEVCQLFGTTRYMDKHCNLGTELKSAAHWWSVRDQRHDDFSQSHPGLAWAARGEWIRDHPLYCHMVGGSNDTVMWKAFSGGMARLRLQDRMSAAFRRHVLEYCEQVGDVQVGFVDGCLVHLHHGDLRARDYEARWDLPWYDPHVDVRLDAAGLLTWTSDEAREKFRAGSLLLRDS